MGDLDDFKLDIFEIFGGEVKAEATVAEAPPPPPSSKAPAKESKPQDDDKVLKEYEDKKKASAEAELAQRMAALEAKFQAELEAKEKAIREAYERGKNEAEKSAPAPSGAAPAAADPAQLPRKCLEILQSYEEFRLILYYKLAPVVGEKATKTMLQKSFEKAREKYPDLLKNGNWDDKGQLLEDGGLNAKKIVENISKIPAEGARAQLEESLRLLLHLRLSAVQKGLGNQLTAGLVKSMSARLQELDGKHDPDCVKALGKMLPT